MAVIIGSARHDEHGNCYSGGKDGYQTRSIEVSRRNAGRLSARA